MTVPTTNQMIAELLKHQTYDERIEMAAWFRDVAADAEQGSMDADWFAFNIGSWAEAVLEAMDDEARKAFREGVAYGKAVGE